VREEAPFERLQPLPRLVAPLGRGPAGTIYVGYRRNQVPSYVTVKLIDSTLDGDRFCRDIQKLSERLRRPLVAGVAMTVGAGVTEDLRAFVIAEYIRGFGFATFVRSRQIDVASRLRVIRDLAGTVSDLHRRGIVHGSVKSTNVVVTVGEKGLAPVLLDVGVWPALTAARWPPAMAISPAGAEPSVTFGCAEDTRALVALVLDALDTASASGARHLRRRLTRRDTGYESASDLACDLERLTS
jgi:serine/threonine protein kinase